MKNEVTKYQYRQEDLDMDKASSLVLHLKEEEGMTLQEKDLLQKFEKGETSFSILGRTYYIVFFETKVRVGKGAEYTITATNTGTTK